MENASKALIIAGAILISILLISIGIMVIQSANGVIDSAGTTMDAQAKQTFNAQFQQYTGESVRGSTVKTLLNAIIASNGSNDQKVEIDGSLGTDPAAAVGSVSASAKYKVTFTTTTDGVINKISINKV